MFSKCFPKIVHFIRKCGKIWYSQTGHRWQYSRLHAGTLRVKTTCRICNNYCFSTKTTVTRTCLNVTLYVHCLTFCLTVLPPHCLLYENSLLTVCHMKILCFIPKILATSHCKLPYWNSPHLPSCVVFECCTTLTFNNQPTIFTEYCKSNDFIQLTIWL